MHTYRTCSLARVSSLKSRVPCLHDLMTTGSVNILSVRHARRFINRTPIKIFPPEKMDPNRPFFEVERSSNPFTLADQASKEVQHKFAIERRTLDSSKPGRTSNDDLFPVKNKLTEKDPYFSELTSLVNSRKQREQKKKVVLEGVRLIRDALETGLESESIIFTREKELKQLPMEKLTSSQIYQSTHKDMKFWSSLVTPPGILGVFSIKNVEKLALRMRSEASVSLIPILDNIRDPGNLGTLLRTSAAVGCQKVILTKGCVDLWEPKVLRGSMGAHFRVPIITNVEWPLVHNHLPQDCTVFLADSSSSYLPFSSETDSISKNDPIRTVSVSYKKRSRELEEGPHVPLSNIPVVSYEEIRCEPNESIALIIGGETGLSPQAAALCESTTGFRLFIPMSNGIESLNAGVSFAVLAYHLAQMLKNRIERIHSECEK
ncbi:unnamed protein product [Darwinula stevensoni]|uniref:rRNA methyltransferase 3, mitochondrial n=1 Tax=Darwinula stevensoni TaxID=69355 RepID=A0A7R8X6Q5_9CRUS|nr:unnamed protein product [Darwinula stevensoni]CAG0886125.1 unnamed protein product [Darwinula stevensoni]